MKVSRTISIDLEYLTEIQKRIDECKISNLSEFVQKAVKNELKGD
jgi:metal-responsive CopG/Arc/MetJ family transcriptional regulator